MNIDLTKPWKEVFALVAEAKADERREKQFREALEELDRRDREKHLAKAKHDRQEEQEQAFELMLATTERLAEFSDRLDELDTASVKALMRNGEALDRVRAQLDDMVERADKLPDGRRIFKTQDGTRVFDEHGTEIPDDVINPHSIDDRHSRWEPFKALQEEKVRLEAERHELLAYQNKLDQTHARLDKGGVTNKELDALDADLKSTMPPAIRDEIEHRSGKQDGPQQRSGGAAPIALSLDKTLRNAAPPPNPM